MCSFDVLAVWQFSAVLPSVARTCIFDVQQNIRLITLEAAIRFEGAVLMRNKVVHGKCTPHYMHHTRQRGLAGSR
jgi:hypothetical protein